MTRPAALLCLLAALLPTAAFSIELKGDWKQGEVILGRVQPGSQVEFKGKPVRVSDDGRFIVGLDRDEASPVELSIREPGQAAQLTQHVVEKREYSIQRLNGLPPDKVNAPPEVKARLEREGALVREARMQESARMNFAWPFIWPCEGRISGVYGSQRILNGEKKQPHYGVDVAVPTGTPIKAPAGGVVVLAEPDLYFTGGTLLIEHGHGLVSAFLHLSALQAKVGDVVKQGDVVALSGATGRATGPHLDWRVSWFDARVDAQRLVPPMPAAKRVKKP